MDITDTGISLSYGEFAYECGAADARATGGALLVRGTPSWASESHTGGAIGDIIGLSEIEKGEALDFPSRETDVSCRAPLAAGRGTRRLRAGPSWG